MKKIIFITIFSVLTTTIFGQDSNDLPYSVINIVRTKSFFGSALGSYIRFENQQPFGLPVGGVVQYKIYSEGEISIGAEYAGTSLMLYCNLNVKRGNEYYVYLNVKKFGEVAKEDIQKILNKPSISTKREENLDFPINRNSLKDIAKKNGEGQGTCFLISSDGYFITNFHCIENAKEITVKGIDGDFTTKYGATVIASDPSNDLALIKVNNKNIKFTNPPFSIRSSGVAQAEKVYALGYPKAEAMGEEIKITEGIISAKSGVQGDISKFQISAAVNPGNSGGPLIDEEGYLIGVIYAKSNIAESAGYAVKASYLEAFLKNIDNFNLPVLTNHINDKTLPQKVETLRNYIFIIETK